MFHAYSHPLLANRRTVTMVETDTHGSQTQRNRPAARILLKDAPQPSWKAVRTLDDEHFLLAWGGPYVGSENGVELRTLTDLVDTFPGLSAPLLVHGRRLLANGPLSGGYDSSTRVFDLDERRVVAELPVAPPFALSREGLFGRVRKRYDFESSPIAAPELVGRFPELGALIEPGGGFLVHCDLDGKVLFTLSEEELASPYAELTGLALSQDESTLYYSGHRSVGAVDVLSGRLRWVRHFGENLGERHLWLRRIALSPDETRLAVGGAGGPKEPFLRILSTLDGDELDSIGASWRIDSLMFHGSVLFAGGNGGRLLFIDEQRQRRELKVASAGINDLAVLGGGLLCACDQRQLRYLPLLDDE